MPKIQTYDRQVTPTGRLTKTATPAEHGAPVGAAIQDIANLLLQKRAQDQRLWAEHATSQSRQQWAQRMSAMEESVTPGAPEYTEQFLAEFAEYHQQALENAPSQMAREMLDLDLARMQAQLTERAVRFEAAERTRFNIERTQRVVIDNTNAVRADPSMLYDVLDQHQRMIEGLNLPPAEAETFLRGQREQVAHAAMRGLIDGVDTPDDVRGLRKMLADSDEWKNLLSVSAYHEAMKTLAALEDHLLAQRRRDVLEGLQDAIPEMEAGLHLDQAREWHTMIDDAFDEPKDRDHWKRRVDRAATLGGYVNEVKTAGFDELSGMVNVYEQKVAEKGEYRQDVQELNYLMQAIRLRQSQLEQDPAAYVLTHNNQARKAYSDMERAETPEEMAEATQRYVSTMNAEQERLMGPYAEPYLLTREHMTAMAAELLNVERTPEGAQDAYHRLAARKAEWGKHWPQIHQQLQDYNVLSGVDAVVAGMDRPDQAVAAQSLLRYSAIGAKELKKMVDDEKAVSEIHRATIAALADLQGTLAPQLGGPDRYLEFQEAVEVQALGHYALGGMPHAKAVQRAAKEIITDNYTFWNTFRVPRAIDGNKVKRASELIKRDIKNYPIVPPVSAMGLTDEQARAKANNLLRSERGVWITNGDETGLQMMWLEDDGVTLTHVEMEDDNGRIRPFVMTWDDLLEIDASKGWFDPFWRR